MTRCGADAALQLGECLTVLKIALLAAACLFVPATASADVWKQPGSPCKSTYKSWHTNPPGGVNWRWNDRQGFGHDVFGTVTFNDGRPGAVHIAPIPGKGYCLVSEFKDT